MKNKFHQSVQYQFLPYRYGSTWADLVDDKWNIVVVSIEGFISGMMNCNGWEDEILINIINDTELDVKRDGRDALAEERINKAILHPFAENSHWECIETNEIAIPYSEILLSDLKTFRDDKTKLLERINKIIEEAK